MKSKGILSVLSVAKTNRCRPSTLFGLIDPYVAYCFDEACTYITKQLEDGNEPQFRGQYRSFSDMYKQYE